MKPVTSHTKLPREAFVDWLLLLLMGAAAFLPAEVLRINGKRYWLALYFQQSFWLLAGVIVLLFAIQGLVWAIKKRWVRWPAALSGLHLSAFASIRIYDLWQLGKTWEAKQPVNPTDHAAPAIGLYLLLLVGMVLLAIQGLLMRKNS